MPFRHSSAVDNGKLTSSIVGPQKDLVGPPPHLQSLFSTFSRKSRLPWPAEADGPETFSSSAAVKASCCRWGPVKRFHFQKGPGLGWTGDCCWTRTSGFLSHHGTHIPPWPPAFPQPRGETMAKTGCCQKLLCLECPRDGAGRGGEKFEKKSAFAFC